MNLRHLALTLIALISTSCINTNKVSIDDVGDLVFRGATLSQVKLELPVTVTNDFGHNIEILSAEGHISAGGKVIADIRLADEVLIPRRTTTQVGVQFIVKSKGSLGLLSLVPYAKNRDLQITGFAKVRSGVLTKKVKLKDYSIGNLSNFVEIPDLLGL